MHDLNAMEMNEEQFFEYCKEVFHLKTKSYIMVIRFMNSLKEEASNASHNYEFMTDAYLGLRAEYDELKRRLGE